MWFSLDFFFFFNENRRYFSVKSTPRPKPRDARGEALWARCALKALGAQTAFWGLWEEPQLNTVLSKERESVQGTRSAGKHS